ncbi:MAG: NUDIX hydrolase [Acinetobacter junii]
MMNDKNELLLVRKKNTRVFMQVGGKLEPNEAPEIAIQREILEEIGSTCDIKQYLGRYETATANEPDHQLISHLFVVELHQQPEIAAEIAEMKWIDLHEESILLAPLTTEVVIPWCLKQ